MSDGNSLGIDDCTSRVHFPPMSPLVDRFIGCLQQEQVADICLETQRNNCAVGSLPELTAPAALVDWYQHVKGVVSFGQIPRVSSSVTWCSHM